MIAAAYANDPLHWTAALPTPGRPLPPGDRDGDGLPDDWEIARGTDPNVPDGDADPDGDGMDNREEYIAGTDPLSDISVLRLIPVSPEGDETRLQFQAMPQRTYTLLYRDSLANGPWQKIIDVPASATDTWITLSDPAPAPPVRFYRLVTPALP
jgi:hypothetical protein